MDKHCKDIKEREVFVSRQIKAVVNDRNFDEILGGSDNEAWEAFVLVVNIFKTPIQTQLVERMLQAYVRNGCRMLLKILFILICT
jgi:hypothetical protein